LEKYLFIGAHPDDIELGAGATIAKATQASIECHALVFSDCHETLNHAIDDQKKLILESQRALVVLGLEPRNIHFLNFQVRNFASVRQEILQHLIDKSRSEGYSRVYVPASSDMHQDHGVINVESMRAFKFCTLLGYELPWNGYKSDLRYFNILNIKHTHLKKLALQEFQSQHKRFYFDEEKIEVGLKFRGLQINSEYAEAFEVLRWIDI
jgi:LmbE family N-acetylglucosaminyl deacetylase